MKNGKKIKLIGKMSNMCHTLVLHFKGASGSLAPKERCSTREGQCISVHSTFLLHAHLHLWQMSIYTALTQHFISYVAGCFSYL